MKKMPCVFVREFTANHSFTITPQVTPGAEWVVLGEGTATHKYDGTCCLVKEGKLFKRYDAKKGKIPPANFVPAQSAPDKVTGHFPGWVPVLASDPNSMWHWAAWVAAGKEKQSSKPLEDGTYELCGPHFQTNPENFQNDTFIKHGASEVLACPRSFEGLRDYLKTFQGEGVVFHHPDGRMAKIRRDDFGYNWPIKSI